MPRLFHTLLLLLLLCSLPVKAYTAAFTPDCLPSQGAPLTHSPHDLAASLALGAAGPAPAALAHHQCDTHRTAALEHQRGKCHGGACCVAAALPLSSPARAAAGRAPSDPAPYAMRNIPQGLPSPLDRPPRLLA
jgi:hypothetical protein